MPLSPSPLLPGTSPLPTPGLRPPDRRALRVGALVAVPVLVVAMVLGSVAMPKLLFLAPFLQAQAGGGKQAGGATFQGFVYPWMRKQSGGGYNLQVSLLNMRNEADTFHMNTVVIPVYADMPHRDVSQIEWHAGDADNQDTLTDDQYEKAIKDARTAGLIPILELEIRQQDSLSNGDQSAYWVGKGWFDSGYDKGFLPYVNAPSSIVVGPTERAFMDNYTTFAIHYAQMSAQYHLPYFIIGDDLSSITYDTANTVKSRDPKGVAGGPSGCTGRRDCEWRHVVGAIRGASYTPLTKKGTQPGGNYSGKLIYSAGWGITSDEPTSKPEYSAITWWDAVDYIGVDAHFPLTHDSDVSIDTLSNAWHGKGHDTAGQGDIYTHLGQIADKFSHSIIFTSAGYESAAGSNGSPGLLDLSSVQNADYSEQSSDMAALLTTFNDAPWWEGVFWYADEPLAYGSQPHWAYSTAWAGATLSASKPGGRYLASYYQDHPLPCGC